VSDVARELLQAWRATSPLEVVALVTGLAYAVLAVRRDRRCWVFGGCSSAVLAWLAARSALPMQSALQLVYVALSVYGFLSWSTQPKAGARSGIGTWPARRHAAALALVAALSLALAPLLAGLSDAAWPRLDTATTLASLLATWMVARALLENWLYWIVIDAVLAFLYASQGLMLVVLLYVIYLAIAVVGYASWLKASRSS
jgi:nicotinamide mononucleotide transporter